MQFRIKKTRPDYNGGARMHYTAGEIMVKTRVGKKTASDWTHWLVDRWNRPGTVDEYEEIICRLIVRMWKNGSEN